MIFGLKRVNNMHPRYNLRDLRVLNLPDCDARMTIALVAIARGINRAQLRVLLHQFDFRFTDTEYTDWRKAVFASSRLSDEAKNWSIVPFPDRQTEELSALKRQGITRWDARHVHGLQFTDADWTDA